MRYHFHFFAIIESKPTIILTLLYLRAVCVCVYAHTHTHTHTLNGIYISTEIDQTHSHNKMIQLWVVCVWACVCQYQAVKENIEVMFSEFHWNWQNKKWQAKFYKRNLNAVDKNGPSRTSPSSCSGALDRITWSSSADGVVQLSWKFSCPNFRFFVEHSEDFSSKSALRVRFQLPVWPWKQQLIKTFKGSRAAMKLWGEIDCVSTVFKVKKEFPGSALTIINGSKQRRRLQSASTSIHCDVTEIKPSWLVKPWSPFYADFSRRILCAFSLPCRLHKSYGGRLGVSFDPPLICLQR